MSASIPGRNESFKSTENDMSEQKKNTTTYI